MSEKYQAVWSDCFVLLCQKDYVMWIWIFSFKTKFISVYAFGLSLCLSAWARFSSCKYSSNVLKFIYVFHIWYYIDRVKNNNIEQIVQVQRSTKVLKFFNRENFLKCILTYLNWTKYNEISINHSDIQKHASYKNWINSINILYKSIFSYKK